MTWIGTVTRVVEPLIHEKQPREKETQMEIDSPDAAGTSALRSYGSGPYSHGPYQETRDDAQPTATSGEQKEHS